MENVKRNTAYDTEVASKTEWAVGSGTPETNQSEAVETKTPIFVISSSELQNEFLNPVIENHSKHKQFSILRQLIPKKYRRPELEYQLEEPWWRDYKENKYLLIDGLLYQEERCNSSPKVIDRDHILLILQ
ncbi:hypothetical protein O181_010688 [Austropuccinia psidii MF-1]|uniref:Uncharacterized protein n=1 Tax=Austropuccinia psidii MF-1 TaxID=1389203 RepID=A0A9Q3BTH2_9BASI|nr:hypothetical protein [Austropuccinia psidii MF-1]